MCLIHGYIWARHAVFTDDVVTLGVADDAPSGGTDADIQLLEAAKAGDLEVVKVKHVREIDKRNNCNMCQLYC